jgi:hypothetical protein
VNKQFFVPAKQNCRRGGPAAVLEGSKTLFFKKRTKKLLVLRALAITAPTPTGIKVFLLLFVHKK